MGHKDAEKNQNGVIGTVHNVSHQQLQVVMGSMGKRIRACMDLEGGKTKNPCLGPWF